MIDYPLDKKIAILLVDDDPLILDVLRVNVSRFITDAAEIICASSGLEALEITKDIVQEDDMYIGIVVTDFIMPKMLGSEFLLKFNEIQPRTKKIMLTGQADAEKVITVMAEMEMFRFITKPWNPQAFSKQILSAFEEFIYLKKLELKCGASGFHCS